jgi:hypothetical protein
MIDFEKTKSLFIIYPPSTGGNHVANLISLHPSFNPRYQWDRYEETMLANYRKMYFERHMHTPKSANAHFNHTQNIKNINEYSLEDKWVFDQLPNGKKNVFMGHYTNYANLVYNNGVNLFRPYVSLVMTDPEVNSIPYIRNKLSGFDESSYCDATNYNIPCTVKLPGTTLEAELATEENSFLFKSEDLFTEDGYKNLSAALHKNIGIELDEKYDKLHQYWYKLVTFHV